ncbi:hypothetical protein IRP63_04855 [Clostridium botulinum]|uniref:Uncharacterized protein n=1 Tax=Clostridium botulinum C/D str. DC5 TaxID=1443128 RepID=A0A0A0IFN1_CLOBO|nr:hypothetical protein [Clostridium botulinum]KEI05465.1 hypothetical protein Z952_05325 [Clostridium botulinum C/D str. BKT75002]KEI09416.1 hypothetical protein Z954_12855 [Clostridium botulinum C/D str. BKT2873]KGM94403.1 hypothetical protein Z956_07775 [Clostridium botulinum D str. CCUG 7971]KGN00230.1 hypothetical protein Z955_04335 [Clostridium botulinum C/D str. DC5]KOC50167.1 hypothetical protein ADU89_14680 [Clostridium botulinum]
MDLQSTHPKYHLSLVNIFNDINDNISSITLNVIDSSTNTPITNLTSINFRILNNANNNIPIDFTIQSESNTTGDYQLNFTTHLNNNSYLLILTSILISSIDSNEPTLIDTCNPLYINFAQKFDNNGQVKINYPISKPGTYKFSLSKLNNSNLNLTSNSIKFIDMPSAKNSSINPIISKPYLVQILDTKQDNIPVLVSLKDTDGKSIDNGNFEICLYNNIQ